MRRRAEKDGWDTLKPYEMVELVLFYAVPRRNVTDVARRLVDRFDTVGGVFSASREQLLEVPGMSPSMAEWIELTGALMRAYNDQSGAGSIRLSCYQEMLAFLESRPRLWKEAGLWAIYADFNFHLITFSGMRNRAAWWDADNTRRIMVEAIDNGARYVYMILWTGNGPRGLDKAGIERLDSISVSLRAVDLDLADCLLVGSDGIYSMVVQGGLRSRAVDEGLMELRERYARPL